MWLGGGLKLKGALSVALELLSVFDPQVTPGGPVSPGF